MHAGTPHADVQGAGDDMLAHELGEAGPGGVQGPILASAAQAPNPLLVVDNEDAGAGRGGARRIGSAGAGAGSGPAEGAGVW